MGKSKSKKNSFKSKYNVLCPCCGKPAQKTGDQVFCEFCDAEFTCKKKGGFHLRKSGCLQRLEKRISTLEGGRQNSDEAEQSQGIFGGFFSNLFGDDQNEDILPP